MTAAKKAPAATAKTGLSVQFSAEDGALQESLRLYRPAEVTYLVADGDEEVVLDGRRLKAAAEAEGLATRPVKVAGVDDPRQARRIIQATARRSDPLSITARAKAIAEELDIEIGARGRGRESTQRIADELGVHPKALQRALRASRAVEAHPDIAAGLANGAHTAEEAVSLAKRREAEQRRAELAAQAPRVTPDRIDLRLGSFVDQLQDLGEGSVRAIVTDPMWQHDDVNLALWGHVGALAMRTLTDDGMLVVYSGGTSGGEAIARLSAAGLRLVQIGSLACPPNLIKTLSAIETTTPIFYFTTGAAARNGSPFQLSFADRKQGDLVYVEKHDRTWHEWQKPLAVVRHHVEALTGPGDLVIDPFLGGATTAVACLQTGRQFIGAEIDPETLAIARARLAKVTPGVIEAGK